MIDDEIPSFTPSHVTIKTYHENCSNEITRGIGNIMGWILHFDITRNGTFINYTLYRIHENDENFRQLLHNIKQFGYFADVSYYKCNSDYHLFCYKGKMDKAYVPVSDILEKYECHFIYPIEILPDWEKWHLFIKNRHHIRDCISELREVAEVHLEDITYFNPEKIFQSMGGDLISLTSRQKEILQKAISMGYFESPRKCSLRDVAENLNISHTAVNKHIRKIEKRLLKNFF
jgi:predicted DNA binding protein